MKKLLLLFIALAISSLSYAQVVKTIPGDYATIASAITYINSNPIPAGGITFNIASGYTETITNSLKITASGSAANPISFIGNGTTHAIITRSNSGTLSPDTIGKRGDALIVLQGADYITFDYIDLIATNQGIEYGYYFIKNSGIDGCRNISIKHGTIDLTRGTNPYVVGICISNRNQTGEELVVSTTGGRNENISILGNIIQDVAQGIVALGYNHTTAPYDYYDQNLQVGDFDQGNIIRNFGGGSISNAVGVQLQSQNNVNVNYNTISNIDNGGVLAATNLFAINHITSVNATGNYNYNSIKLYVGTAAAYIRAIQMASGGKGFATANNNTIIFKSGSTSDFYGIYIGGSDSTVTANNNHFKCRGSISTSPCWMFFHRYSSNTPNSAISNLTFSGNMNDSTWAKTGNGELGCYKNENNSAPAGIETVTNNTFSNLTLSSSTGNIYAFYSSLNTNTKREFSGNTVSNFTNSGTFNITVAYLQGGKEANIYNNTFSTVVGANSVVGYTAGVGSSLPGYMNIYNNNISGFSTSAAAGSVTGFSLNVQAGVVQNVYNNNVWNMNSTAAPNTGSNQGINIAGGVQNVYNNKVYKLKSNGNIIGILSSSNSAASSIYENQLYNFSDSLGVATTVYMFGIQVTTGVNMSIYNNMIYNFRCPKLQTATVPSTALPGPPLVGINIGGSATQYPSYANVYNNTVYLNSKNTGGQFGSAALYANAGSSLIVSNNILVNLSTPKGTGIQGVTSAFRRSQASLASYSTVSNGNCFYAGNEDATHAVYQDAATPAVYTMATFSALVGPVRDAASFREFPPFTDTATFTMNMKLKTNVPTGCESGGFTVPFITDDFEGDIRYGNSGYAGSGAAYDVGADEFNGTAAFGCTTPIPGNTIVTPVSSCWGAPITLSLQNTTPNSGVRFQWQSSVDGSSFTNIDNSNYVQLTVSASAALWYRCIVTCLNGPTTGTSTPVHVTYSNSVIGTTPASRCGVGTVNLEATGVNAGIMQWYSAAVGGQALASGSSFATPAISATTTYYVSESSSGGYQTSERTAPAAFTNMYPPSGTGLGLQFTATTAFTLQSVDIYASAANDVSIILQNSSGMLLQSIIFPATAAGASVAQTVNLNWLIPVGTGYRILALTGPPNPGGLVRENTTAPVPPFTFPLSLGGNGNITGGFSSGSVSTTIYYYFYNWKMSTVCESPRTPVIATVNTPPAFSITPDMAACNNIVVPISVTSNLSNYSSYIWSPISDLYYDANCLIPYTGISAPTLYYKKAAAGLSTYTCTAEETVNNCKNVLTLNITNLPASLSISADTVMYCQSGYPKLKANPATGYGSVNALQWQSSLDNVTFTDIPGANNAIYKPIPPLTTSTYFRLETRSGVIVCQQSNALLITVDAPQTLSTSSATRCGAGSVTLSATTNPGSEMYWWASATGGIPMYVGNSFTTPTIASTTTYYVTSQVAHYTPSTIANTTTAWTDHPFNAPFGNKHEQMIWSLGQLTPTGMVPGYINSIAFNVSSLDPEGDGLKNFSVKLGNTTITDMTYGMISSGAFTEVYSNPNYVITDTGANIITFATPWYWTGTQNIVIDICYGDPVSTNAINYGLRSSSGITGNSAWTYYTSASNASTICSDIATNRTSSFYRPNITFVSNKSCATARQAVVANVTLSPSIVSISGDLTLCNNTVGTLSVTSNLSDFDSYSWQPASKLYTDAGCTIPYTGSATTVYFKSTTAGTYTYNCVANNSGSGCGSSASVVVTNLPAVVTIVNSNPSICASGTAVLSSSPAYGWGSAGFQWQISTDNVNFTNVLDETSQNLTTPTLTANTYYKLLITGFSGLCSSPQTSIVVNNPQITVPAQTSRCGVGTVNLNVTGNGNFSWFETPTSWPPVGTGATFTTPVISANKTYYARAEASVPVIKNIGLVPSATNGTYSNTQASFAFNTGLVFRATSDFDLKTVDIYPNAPVNGTPGTVTIRVVDSLGNVYNSATVNVTGYIQDYGLSAPQTVNLNFHIVPPPTVRTYRLVMGGYTGVTGIMYRSSGTALPYPYDIPGVGVIRNGMYNGSLNFQYWGCFFNWSVDIPCVTARTPVVAVVDAPPTLTLSSDQTVCNNDVATIGVLSTPANFNSYIWSPTTGLFTDAACTVPYTGTSETTLYFKSTTGGANAITCTATDGSSCVNVKTVNVFNLPVAPALASTPTALCSSGTAEIAPVQTSGWGAATFQWQNSPDGNIYTDITLGGTNQNYITPSITATSYYKLLISNGGNLCTSSTISVAVDAPVITKVIGDTTCGYGSANLLVQGSGGTFRWYDSPTSSTVLGTGNTFAIPRLMATTTYYVNNEGYVTTKNNVGYVPTVYGTSAAGTNVGLKFKALKAFTLKSVVMYPIATSINIPGTVTISVVDSLGNYLHAKTVNILGNPQVNGLVPQTVDLNFEIKQQTTGLRLLMTGFTGVTSFMYTSGTFAFPYNVPGVVSIIGYVSGTTVGTNNWYDMYNWTVETSCSAGRQPVVALFNAPPAITPTATPSTICAGASTTLNVPAIPAYDMYLWLSPTDTVPGNTQLKTPSVTTVYTVVAINASTTGCINALPVPVIVNPVPTPITVTPPTSYAGSITNLIVSGGAYPNTVFSENFDGAVSGWTITNGPNSLASSNWDYFTAPFTGNWNSGLVSFTNFPNASATGKFIMARPSMNAAGKTTTTVITSPSFSTRGYTASKLYFDHIFRAGFNTDYVVRVEISSDGGSTWSLLKDYNTNTSQGTISNDAQAMVKDSIVLTSYLNMANLKIRYNYVSGNVNNGYWIIDNILVKGTPSPVAITWAPITGLYTNAAATVPYTAGTPASSIYANPTGYALYTATATNGYPCSITNTATIYRQTKDLNLKAFLEGLYNTGSGIMNQAQGISGPEYGAGIADVVAVELHAATAPYGLVYEFSPINMATDGTIDVNSIPGADGGSYYVVIKHRNSLETWSAIPISFSDPNTTSYDFTTSASQAYGSNMKQSGLAWLFYAGDATQDGVVDGSDMASIDNASTVVLAGYNSQDVNGDGIVDGSDMAFIDNNATAIIQVAKP